MIIKNDNQSNSVIDDYILNNSKILMSCIGNLSTAVSFSYYYSILFY